MIEINNMMENFLTKLATEFCNLNKIGKLNEIFFNSWGHCKKGPSNCHDVVLNSIKKGFSPTIYFENQKIQHGVAWIKPDLIFFDKSCISLVVDYESPNSSDDRLIGKDFEKYLNFRKKSNLNIPYVVITTLPIKEDGKKIRWRLRRDKSNPLYKTDRDKILENPREYWLEYYQDWWKNNKKNAALIDFRLFNINSVAIEQVLPINDKINDIKIIWN